jgi:hypothetical protein
MDALLQILLPEIKQLPNLERYQRVFTWDGTEYPQEPVEYLWGPQVKLVTSHIKQSLFRFLPRGYVTEHWVALDVDRQTLDLLAAEINGQQVVDWFGSTFDELIRRLLTQYDHWVLVFEPGYDQIDNVYRMKPEECISKLRANLKWPGPMEGFVALPSE